LLTQLQNPLVYLPLIAALLGLLVGALITWLHAQREIQALNVEKVRLETRLQGEKSRFDAQLEQLRDARKTLSRQFAVLSRQALKDNSSLFLKIAGENLKRHQERASAELREKEQSIETLVTPIRELLDRTRDELRQMEKERKESFGSLSRQIETLARSEIDLRRETSQLVSALKRPDVRGRWGEMTLKRLVELAGMVEHCDFDEQIATTGDDDAGLLRPDMIIRMPGQRELIIDAKTPLDGYLAAIDADTDEQRQAAMTRHARNLRDRVRALSSKAYWAQFRNSPDFVILFLPGDPFLGGALAEDKDLMEYALQRNIILATPASLMGLLRSVAHGWKQIAFNENSERIRQTGEDLYRRIAILTEHFQRLGKSLNASVDHYNKTLGSLERQLLPGARRMSELGIRSAREVADIAPLERTARPSQSSER